MNEFELSIKSRPGGSEVVCKGNGKQIVVEFAMLAAAVSKNTGLPLGLLAEAVNHAGELYEHSVKESCCVDMTKIHQARGEK